MPTLILFDTSAQDKGPIRSEIEQPSCGLVDISDLPGGSPVIQMLLADSVYPSHDGLASVSAHRARTSGSDPVLPPHGRKPASSRHLIPLLMSGVKGERPTSEIALSPALL